MKNGASSNQKHSASLGSFVKTGVLGCIAVGQLANDIEEILGKPEDCGFIGKIKIESYLQKRLQLSFKNNRLILIAIYFKDSIMEIPNDLIRLVWDLPREAMNSEKALFEWLTNDGISIRSRGYESSESSTWVVEEGASVTYSEGRLYSIQST